MFVLNIMPGFEAHSGSVKLPSMGMIIPEIW